MGRTSRRQNLSKTHVPAASIIHLATTAVGMEGRALEISRSIGDEACCEARATIRWAISFASAMTCSGVMLFRRSISSRHSWHGVSFGRWPLMISASRSPMARS